MSSFAPTNVLRQGMSADSKAFDLATFKNWPKRSDGTADWRTLHREDIHDL